VGDKRAVGPYDTGTTIPNVDQPGRVRFTER
jgi:hypothetical protein